LRNAVWVLALVVTLGLRLLVKETIRFAVMGL
jgi:hypothetical protein